MSDDETRCRFVGSRNLPRAPDATPYDKPPEPRAVFTGAGVAQVSRIDAGP